MTHPGTTSIAVYKPTREMLKGLHEWVQGKRGTGSGTRATPDEIIHALIREAAKSSPELKKHIRTAGQK